MESALATQRDALLDAQRQLFSPLRIPVLARAAEALAAGKLHVAKTLLSKYLTRDPKSADACNGLSIVAASSRQMDRAVEWARRAIEAAPSETIFQLNYGKLLVATGDFTFVNNVLFNWQHRTMDGGDGSSRVNVVNNYYKPGPATHGELRYRICRLHPRWPKDDHPGAGR